MSKKLHIWIRKALNDTYVRSIYVFADKDNGRVNVKVNGHKTRDIRSHDLEKIECQL